MRLETRTAGRRTTSLFDQDTFRLRAERSDNGTGRIYTIIYRATDACGNTTTASTTVTVPRGS
jgi:hypothetical protein